MGAQHRELQHRNHAHGGSWLDARTQPPLYLRPRPFAHPGLRGRRWLRPHRGSRLECFAGSVKWVMVDAVPAILVYARDYLRAACPDARIGCYYDSDAADIESFDCYIAPAGHFEGLSSRCLHRLVRSHRRRRRDLLHLQRARRPIPRFVELPADMAAVVLLQHPGGRGRTITRRRYSYPRPVTIARSTRQSKPPTAAACRGGFRHATACRPRWSRNSTPTGCSARLRPSSRLTRARLPVLKGVTGEFRVTRLGTRLDGLQAPL